MSEVTRSEWINDSDGVHGVVVFDEEGRRGGLAVKPGKTIWLTEKERIATANAPEKESDNPFANGVFRCVTPASDVKSRRSFGTEAMDVEMPVAPSEPTIQVEVAPGLKMAMTAAEKDRWDKAQDEASKPREEKPAIPDEVGAPPLPQGDPETGVRSPGEEVGRPDVVKQSGTRARKTGRGVTVDSSNPLAKPAPAEGVPTGVVMTTAGPQVVEAK